jgi:uroporphyrinogen III methyltransferase/synthase
VLEAPTIELVEPSSWNEADAALNKAGSYDWIIFTSANGVRFTRERLRTLKKDVRIFGNAKIAAIGDATADAIRDELCLNVDLCPQSFVRPRARSRRCWSKRCAPAKCTGSPSPAAAR